MRRYEITDQQWQRIAHLLPGKVGHVGRSAVDNRLFINAVLWIARSGAPGGMCPSSLARGTRSTNAFDRSAGAAGPKQACGKLFLTSCRSQT